MDNNPRPTCFYCEEVECDLILDFGDVAPDMGELPCCNGCLRVMFDKAFEPEGAAEAETSITRH